MNKFHLKQEYNKLLTRYEKGVAYLDDESISVENREKYIPMMFGIIKKLAELSDTIKNYELILVGYQNYIKAMEQEEPIRTTLLKKMGCDSEEVALENLRVLEKALFKLEQLEQSN